MCFSIEWIGQLVIWLIIIVAMVAIVRLVLPYLLNMLGAGGGLVMAIINIVIWAAVAIMVVYIVIELFSCLLGGGGLGFHRPRP